MATRKPAIGPLAPSSTSASRFGAGVRIKITAPIVPKGGVIGMKCGRPASMPR
jgi:hypothetical protein